MLGFESRRAFHLAVAIDVGNDLRSFFGRIAQLHQRCGNRVVNNLDDAAPNELLVFYEREIGLDAGRVAIHHEADGAGGSEYGDLRILEAEFFAESESVVPGGLRGAEQR